MYQRLVGSILSWISIIILLFILGIRSNSLNGNMITFIVLMSILELMVVFMTIKKLDFYLKIISGFLVFLFLVSLISNCYIYFLSSQSFNVVLSIVVSITGIVSNVYIILKK